MPLDMRHRHSHLLLGYWVGLHKGPLPPHEDELDAAIMRALLPAICLAEMQPDGLPSYRLIGRQLLKRMGKGVIGAPLASFWGAADFAEIQAHFLESARSHRPFFYTSVGRDEAGHWHLFETLWAPIQMDDPQISCFVGVSEPLLEGGASPVRMIGHEALKGIWPLNERRALTVAAAKSSNQSPSHLRLVVS